MTRLLIAVWVALLPVANLLDMIRDGNHGAALENAIVLVLLTALAGLIVVALRASGRRFCPAHPHRTPDRPPRGAFKHATPRGGLHPEGGVMAARNLELEIARNGRHADEIALHADPDDVPTLRRTLTGWLEGNKWSEGRWREFELLVRYEGEYKIRRKVRV